MFRFYNSRKSRPPYDLQLFLRLQAACTFGRMAVDQNPRYLFGGSRPQGFRLLQKALLKAFTPKKSPEMQLKPKKPREELRTMSITRTQKSQNLQKNVENQKNIIQRNEQTLFFFWKERSDLKKITKERHFPTRQKSHAEKDPKLENTKTFADPNLVPPKNLQKNSSTKIPKEEKPKKAKDKKQKQEKTPK